MRIACPAKPPDQRLHLRSTLLTPNNPCSLFFIMYALGAKGELGALFTLQVWVLVSLAVLGEWSSGQS